MAAEAALASIFDESYATRSIAPTASAVLPAMDASTVFDTSLKDMDPAPASETPAVLPASAPATPTVSTSMSDSDVASSSIEPAEWTVESAMEAVTVLSMSLKPNAAPTAMEAPTLPIVKASAPPPASALMSESSLAVSSTEAPFVVVTLLPLRMSACVVLSMVFTDRAPAPLTVTPPPRPPEPAPLPAIVSA